MWLKCRTSPLCHFGAERRIDAEEGFVQGAHLVCAVLRADCREFSQCKNLVRSVRANVQCRKMQHTIILFFSALRQSKMPIPNFAMH